MNIQTTRRARLAQLIRNQYAGSQAKFVEETGENQGEVSALLRDKSFGEKKARKIEIKCKLPHGWLDAPAEEPGASGRLIQVPEEAIPAGKWVAITGIAQGLTDGVLHVAPCPPGEDGWAIYSLSANTETYAFRTSGDGIRPRIKHAEYIIAEPNGKPEPGDDVIVMRKDGMRLIKELLWIRDDEIYLGSINNGCPPLTVQQADIDCIHRISAIVPRGSVLLRKSGGEAVKL